MKLMIHLLDITPVYISTGNYFLTGFFLPELTWIMLLKIFTPLLFHLVLGMLGWVSWTLVEYIAHRFWMHPKQKDGKKIIDHFKHNYHHAHPTDIHITPNQRTMSIGVLLVLVGLSFYFNNYFTWFTGLWAGFVSYMYMHWILHQPWCAKVFPNLLKQHIFHHGKYKHYGFGICTIFWDRVFRTTIPKEASLTEKQIQHYLGGYLKKS